MPEYLHLNSNVKSTSTLRGAIRLTRDQVAMMFDFNENVNLEYVDTELIRDTVAFYFSEQQTSEEPTLAQHLRGSTTISEAPDDLELLRLLENAAANLRAKLTPSE